MHTLLHFVFSENTDAFKSTSHIQTNVNYLLVYTRHQLAGIQDADLEKNQQAKKHGITLASIRRGCPPEMDAETRRKTVREAAKRLTASFKEFQQLWKLLAAPICDNNLLNSSHVLGARVSRQKT